MVVVDLAILIVLAGIAIIVIKGGIFKLPAGSKRAAGLIFSGLATIALLSVVKLFVMYGLPSLPLESEATGGVSHFMVNLYWIGVFFAFVFIGGGLLLVTRLISRYETTLARSESRYQKIVEDQTDLIARWNIDGIRTWVNDSYCEYFQYSREELVGTNFFPLLPEGVIEEYLAKFRLLTPEAPSITGQNTIILPNGSPRWQEWTHQVIFNNDGEHIECQSVGRDITVRKTAEFALMDSEIRYRNLVENTTDWVWQWDLKGNHIFSNSQLEVILGYTNEELSAKSLKELFHPEDISGNFARLSNSVAEQQGWQHWLLRMRHKNGNYRYLDSNAIPQLDASGTMIGFSGIDRDVTFKTLLAECTSVLLAANLGSLQIDEVMRKFAEYFDVDRFELRWRNETEEVAVRTLAWSRAGVEPASLTTRLSETPFLAAQMAGGEFIHVADAGALPPAASAEREVSNLIGSRAFVVFPLRISIGKYGKDRIGSGMADVYDSTRSWTEEEINEFRLAFNLIATAEARLLTRTELKERERFHALVADVSTDLLKVSADVSSLTQALQRFAVHFEVDSLSCWWFDKTNESARRSCSWNQAGSNPGPSDFKRGNLPYNGTRVLAGEVVRVSDASVLNSESCSVRGLNGSIGITASLSVPLQVDSEQDYVGCGVALKFSGTREWPDQEVKDLQIAINVIAIAEARMRVKAELQARERFQALVADVSTDLLKVSVDDLSLTQALHRFALHFNVESLGCWWFDETREAVQRSRSWFREGANLGPSDFGLSSLPYYRAAVLAGEVVRISNANGLNSDSSAERESQELMGVTAALFVPLKLGVGLDHVGTGVALKYGEKRDWSDIEIEDLQLAFNVIAIAEARMQTESELQVRERFQTFLADVSTSLLGAQHDEIGDKIDDCLNRIAKRYDICMAGIWCFEDGNRKFRRVQGGTTEGREMPMVDILSLDMIPWTGARIFSGKNTKLDTIEDIPIEQMQDRNFFDVQGFKSMLVLPLEIDHQQVGVGVFNTLLQARSWSVRNISELRLLAEMLMNVYYRTEATRTVQQRERDLTRSEALAHVGSYSFFPSNSLSDSPPLGKAYFSEEMRLLIDCTNEEASFEIFISRVHKDDKLRVEDSIRELVKQGSVLQHEFRLVGRDGEIIHVEGHSEVDRSKDAPEITKVFGSLKDVSERVVRENELRDAFEQIEKLKENLEEENMELRDEVKSAHGFDKIIGNSRPLQSCLDLVNKVAPTDATVMLLGETGAGKELIAHAIHDQSARKGSRMISVNCAALPASLIESELFGHEKGAFTGAGSIRKGRFELADGGTLFLDEIGELPLPLQSKLLRAIQEGEFERLGGSNTLKVDVRIIAATNRQLKKFVDQGDFRADLYYRISNFPIEVPSLSERKDDIPLLAEHFVRKFAPELGKNIKAISSGMLRYLSERPWPGNVRELEGFIQYALITNEGDVLNLSAQNEETTQPPSGQDESPNGERGTLLSVENKHIINVLNQTTWMISGERGAAKILGVPPSTLRSRMKKLGIEHPDKKSVVE
ncbi:MAG: PAS domain S-box-containing protein [Cyclobacteriaceae bacterium]|jgi:PAS domain S-box-containing protein